MPRRGGRRRRSPMPPPFLTCLLALTLRAATSLHPYSGESSPPLFGDYEAQRHWMEVTTSLPPRLWYRDAPGNNLTYWGLDYPPLSAHVSRVAGAVLRRIEPAAVAPVASHGHETPASRAAMRASVLVADVLVFFPAVWVLLVKMRAGGVGEQEAEVARGTLAFVLSLPALVLVDHGHFQYNNVSLGLFVASVAAMARGAHGAGAALFCLSVYFKQMSLYYAPAVAVYLLSLLSACYRRRGAAAALGFSARVAGAVVGTTAVVFYPWLPDDVGHILRRVFPFGRGLFEDKVSNVWCTLSLVVKLHRRMGARTLVPLCSVCTIAACAPFCVALARRPSVRKLLLASAGCALAAFLFSYQVHEKQILIPLVPLALLVDEMPRTALWASLVAAFSLYPLLSREGLVVAYVALIALHGIVFFEMRARLPTRTPGQPADPPVPQSAVGAAVGIALLLHALHAYGPPVHSKPDLYVVLMTAYACGHLCLIYAALIFFSFTLPADKRTDKLL